MTLQADYITKPDLKTSLELSGTAYTDRDLDRAIPAASRAIDKLCGRPFGQDAAAVARYYTADDAYLCLTGDVTQAMSAGATVAVDLGGNYAYATTWTANTHYLWEPANAPADNEPYSRLRAILTGFPTHANGVKVTAQFGWDTIPDQIVQACALLATRLMTRAREAPFGVISAGVESGAVMRIARTDPDVVALLEPFMLSRPIL